MRVRVATSTSLGIGPLERLGFRLLPILVILRTMPFSTIAAQEDRP